MIAALCLKIYKFFSNLIYSILKLRKTKNKIVFISRQYNLPSKDFILLKQSLSRQSPDSEIIFLCRTIDKGIIKTIAYCGFLCRCMWHLANARACITDTYNIPVSMLKHKDELTVIQIWHALGAIKKFGHQTLDKPSGTPSKIARVMNMHENYDYVIAPSWATAEHFCGAFHITMDKIRFFGLPRIDYILNDDPVGDKLFINRPELIGKKNILYVPTFRKNKENQLLDFQEHFDFKTYNLILKLHPLDIFVPDNTFVQKAVIVHDEEISLFDLYKICDIIITDYSSAAFEGCLLNKPIYFYLYDHADYAADPGYNIDLFQELPNCTSKSLCQITQWIQHQDYDFNALDKFRKKYIEVDLNRSCTDKLAKFILEGKIDQ